MPLPVETVPVKPFNVEQVIQIVSDVFAAAGQYKIKEVKLAFNDHYPPVEVAGLEERDKIVPDRMFLITALDTGHRYNFVANIYDETIGGCEVAGMRRLKADVSTARLAMLTFDEIDGGWIYWHRPEEPELDIEGQLDPLMYSIVSKLRQ